MNTQLLSTKEAAAYLSLAPVTLAKWRCYDTPNKPPYIDYGHAIRYSIDDLDAWIKERRRDGEIGVHHED